MEEHRLPKFDYYIDESDPDNSNLAPPGRHVRGCLQRKRGYQGGAPRSRQGGLREADGCQRGPFGPWRRRRPKEERLNLERPYSPECVEVQFSEVAPLGLSTLLGATLCASR